MTRAIILVALLSACGTDHTVRGGTNNNLEANVTVEYHIPICEQPIFDTAESAMACVNAVMRQPGEAEILSDELTNEQIDAILGANND